MLEIVWSCNLWYWYFNKKYDWNSNK